jgi:hypothetical protein
MLLTWDVAHALDSQYNILHQYPDSRAPLQVGEKEFTELH